MVFNLPSVALSHHIVQTAVTILSSHEKHCERQSRPRERNAWAVVGRSGGRAEISSKFGGVLTELSGPGLDGNRSGAPPSQSSSLSSAPVRPVFPCPHPTNLDIEPRMLDFAPNSAWWDPFCRVGPYDPRRFDLTACFSDSTLALAPVAILALGCVASRDTVKRYTKGERPEKGGKGAYAIKLVSRLEWVACVGRQGITTRA